MKAIQSLKEKLSAKQEGFAGLDDVAIGLVIVGVIVVAGFVVVGTLSTNTAIVSDTDAQTAINDTKDGLGNVTTFFSIIAIVAALTVVIVLLRRASNASS